MKNCKGFEYNFINMTDDELKNHLKSCNSCQKEYFAMKQTQNSIRELKPYFKKDNKVSFLKISSIAALFFILLMGFNYYENLQQEELLVALTEQEYLQDGILPLDEYGLLSIE